MHPSPRILADRPARDGDRTAVVIDTPKAGPHEDGHGHEDGAVRRDAVLREDVGFGLVPSPAGRVVSARLVGVVGVWHKRDGRWINDDRPLAAAVPSHASGQTGTLDDQRLHGSLDAGMARAAAAR